ncbi:hypothetical protein AURUGA1_01618 [Aurantimicrobium sp. MWH-Uga1]|nr:hypothetical protein AURUGA1_01618 [Aurantimicrobium sp. MWH-Uga1]
MSSGLTQTLLTFRFNRLMPFVHPTVLRRADMARDITVMEIDL